MTDITFVTGNPNKAKYLSELLEMPIDYHDTDAVEIQSLDLVEIAEYKAREAYRQLYRPVLVEDAGVSILALGRLPGPYIKWFIEEIDLERICRLADSDPDRKAEANNAFVYYDGQIMKHFTAGLKGRISNQPLGEGGYDWDKIFIPEGSRQTLAEMEFEEYKRFHIKIKPILRVKEFLHELDKA